MYPLLELKETLRLDSYEELELGESEVLISDVSFDSDVLSFTCRSTITPKVKPVLVGLTEKIVDVITDQFKTRLGWTIVFIWENKIQNGESGILQTPDVANVDEFKPTIFIVPLLNLVQLQVQHLGTHQHLCVAIL